MLGERLLVLVMSARPAEFTLGLLSKSELLNLACTSEACKKAVSVAVFPQTRDVSDGRESSPVPCLLTLSDLARLIRSPWAYPFAYTKHNVLPSSLKSTLVSQGCSCPSEP